MALQNILNRTWNEFRKTTLGVAFGISLVAPSEKAYGQYRPIVDTTGAAIGTGTTTGTATYGTSGLSIEEEAAAGLLDDPRPSPSTSYEARLTREQLQQLRYWTTPEGKAKMAKFKAETEGYLRERQRNEIRAHETAWDPVSEWDREQRERELEKKRRSELKKSLGLSSSQFSQLEDKVYASRRAEVALTLSDYPSAIDTIDLASRLGAPLEREERMQKLFSRPYTPKPLYPSAGEKGEAKPDSSLEIYEKLFSEYSELPGYDREGMLEKIAEDMYRTGLVTWPLNAQDFPQYVTPLRYRPPVLPKPVLPKVDLDDPSVFNSALHSLFPPYGGCNTAPITPEKSSKWPLVPLSVIAWRSRRRSKQKRT